MIERLWPFYKKKNSDFFRTYRIIKDVGNHHSKREYFRVSNYNEMISD